MLSVCPSREEEEEEEASLPPSLSLSLSSPSFSLCPVLEKRINALLTASYLKWCAHLFLVFFLNLFLFLFSLQVMILHFSMLVLRSVLSTEELSVRQLLKLQRN